MYLLVVVVVLLLDGLVACTTDTDHPQELVDIVRRVACPPSNTSRDMKYFTTRNII